MKKMLPVLYVLDPSIAVTGAFIAARNTAKLLKDSVHIVLVLPQGSSIPADELTDFWRVDHVPMESLSKNLHSLLHYLPSVVMAARALKRSMKSDGATRLQLNDFYLMHGALLRLMGFRGRIISWVRCHPTNFAGPLAKPMVWFAQQAADRMVSVSHAIRTLLPNSVQDVLYDGYNGAVRSPKSWAETDEKKLVYIGNYILGKGQDIALQAFARIAAKDTTLTLAFHGGDMGLSKNQSYRAQLEQFVAQHGLQERVNFHDFTKDTYRVLESAYAALNFSQAESFSMTVLEASGAGVAVIATASGGPQEILIDGQTGYLIPVGDVDAATDRMLQLVRQPDKVRAMGEAGAEHVRKFFSMQQLRLQLLALWEIDQS